jgi:hypothetical protein
MWPMSNAGALREPRVFMGVTTQCAKLRENQHTGRRTRDPMVAR